MKKPYPMPTWENNEIKAVYDATCPKCNMPGATVESERHVIHGKPEASVNLYFYCAECGTSYDVLCVHGKDWNHTLEVEFERQFNRESWAIQGIITGGQDYEGVWNSHLCVCPRCKSPIYGSRKQITPGLIRWAVFCDTCYVYSQGTAFEWEELDASIDMSFRNDTREEPLDIVSQP